MEPLFDQYTYDIPSDLIAHSPVNPRDTARLFVYDTRSNTVSHSSVRDLPRYVAGAQMIVNDTKVLPARLKGSYNSEPIELLILVDQGITPEGKVRALVNRSVQLGGIIEVFDMFFTVLENHEKSILLQFNGKAEILHALLLAHGETPLPPYIKNTNDEAVKRADYQTMFAHETPSVAAPTASLHFTPGLIESLNKVGVTVAPVTLQVGLGTFAPIFAENFANKKLHEEYYVVPDSTAKVINSARTAGRPIMAVGTTVVRTLESAKGAIGNGVGEVGKADLFIYPPYTFTYPDILMTNFHVPKSSLLCLVQAYIEHKGGNRHIVELYQEAIKERYRFYSFGDAMLIV
ncbi:MAG: tRNA preQ1(34) S-adenosylmethionine ribosyltransferase-isomerase QueA [Candidatus Paceibacteria bacterium]